MKPRLCIAAPFRPCAVKLTIPSKVQRERVKHWYDNTLFSRLDNKADDTIILVMQRLHMDDLVAHVLTQGSWDHLDLPAIAEREQSEARVVARVGHGECEEITE